MTMDAYMDTPLHSSYFSASPYSQHKYSQWTFIPPPTLVLMAGFAGVGKTKLASYLEKELGKNWDTLNKDELKLKHLESGKDLQPADRDAFIEQAGWEAFNELFEETQKKIVIEGKSVIADSCGYPAFILETMMKILRDCHLKVKLKVIYCQAPKVTRMQRLKERGSEFEPYIHTLPEIPDDAETTERFAHLPVGTLTLHTDGSFDDYKEKALDYVRSGQSCIYQLQDCALADRYIIASAPDPFNNMPVSPLQSLSIYQKRFLFSAQKSEMWQ